ncbi:MAG TPA: CapA family protein [Mycobacteriales bacterium]|nr:CapA family protein [Mycobacteriales bacterium]
MTARKHALRVAAVSSLVAAGLIGGAGLGSASAQAPAPSPSPAPPAAVGNITIAAVGDTILGSTPTLPPQPAHYLDPVDAALTAGSQIVFANLEGTLTDQTKSKCPPHDDECFAFRNPPRFASYLAAAGFTILNDANNHSFDYGRVGQQQTVRAIHRAGMAQTGLPGEITVVKAGGEKVAFLGFAPYPYDASLLDLKTAATMIREASKEAPIVVVYMHAGAEGSDRTQVTGQEEHFLGEDRGNPEAFAHLAIRNGADLVIASGPHVLRGMQFFRGHLIAYSLGNFANFHNFGSGGVLSDSAILHVTLTPTGAFVTGRLTSVLLDGEGRASLGGGSIALVRSLSREDFGTQAARVGNQGLIRPPAH